MRRMRKKGRKSSVRKLATRLTASSGKRPASLEQRIQGLEGRLKALEDELSIDAATETPQKRPGPRPKISDLELVIHRDELVDFLEVCWPDLGPKLLSASGKEEIIAVLMPYAGPETGRGRIARRLIDDASSLLDYLKSDRFHRKPPKRTVIDALNRPLMDERRMRAAARLPTRQIANAMAGVPELGWRTSLDRCSGLPSRLFVGTRTENHYRELYGVPLPKSGKNQGKP